MKLDENVLIIALDRIFGLHSCQWNYSEKKPSFLASYGDSVHYLWRGFTFCYFVFAWFLNHFMGDLSEFNIKYGNSCHTDMLAPIIGCHVPLGLYFFSFIVEAKFWVLCYATIKTTCQKSWKGGASERLEHISKMEASHENKSGQSDFQNEVLAAKSIRVCSRGFSPSF